MVTNKKKKRLHGCMDHTMEERGKNSQELYHRINDTNTSVGLDVFYWGRKPMTQEREWYLTQMPTIDFDCYAVVISFGKPKSLEWNKKDIELGVNPVRCFLRNPVYISPNITVTFATWLILPVVICLSQRLSHASLSINFYTMKLRMAH